MILFKKRNDLRKWLDAQHKNGIRIGFVPTMGALHAGHISLIKRSKSENPVTVCSIFINPTQFNDPADFKKYPVTIETDINMLEEAGCDVLFLPGSEEIYPEGYSNVKHYDIGYLETMLEGKYRPGHFQGVCMVVDRLLEIVQPDQLYLGQKDYQQCKVITGLIALKGLPDKIRLSICPTLREADGLAMSSRNLRLSVEERMKAPVIFRCLQSLKSNLRPGDLIVIKEEAVSMLELAGLRPDYVEIADADDLSPVTKWDGKQRLVALIAAFLGDIRLIDNLILTE